MKDNESFEWLNLFIFSDLLSCPMKDVMFIAVASINRKMSFNDDIDQMPRGHAARRPKANKA